MSTRVSGNVSFSNNPPKSLPKGSYLVVKFQDISLADAPSVTLGKTIIDAHEALNSQQAAGSHTKIPYSISFDNPGRRGHRYSVSAVLNVGWKASGNDWIRRGDYLTDTTFTVELEDGKNEYNCDVELVFYN